MTTAIGIPENHVTNSTSVWLPEFGLLNTSLLELSPNKYHCQTYSLSPETIKIIAETIGFTARFGVPAVQACYLDLCKTEGWLTFEVARNTKPTDLGLRYAKDRWIALDNHNKHLYSLSPWLKTTYKAKSLPDKIIAQIAESLKLKRDDYPLLVVKINFKDQTAGLIIEQQHVEKLPTGHFNSFSLPEIFTQTKTILETTATMNNDTPSIKEDNTSSMTVSPNTVSPVTNKAAQDPVAKYSTYSRSEVDQMFKQQTEAVTNTLSGKISTQQRALQETINDQEKVFSRIMDKLTIHLDEIRVKLESNTAAHKQETQQLLAQFKTKLERELEQFKMHMNKSVIPNIKTIDGKIASIEETVRTSKQQDSHTHLTVVIIACLLCLLNTILLLVKH